MIKSVLIFAGLLFVAAFLYAGPCPDQLALMRELRAKPDNKKNSLKQEIARWLPYLDSLNNCPRAEDSVIAFLNRKIGKLYSADKDFINAIKYYDRFLSITRANLGKPNFYETEMMTGFYFFSEMYRNLNMTSEWMSALDSCIVYADKTKVNNRTNLGALYQKSEFYLDLGDYYRSIVYATQCETISKICQLNKDSLLRDDGFRYNSSSSAWKVNALLQLGNLTVAEEYIKGKISEAEKDTARFNLDTWNGLLADVYIRKKDGTTAISLLKKALKIARKKGNNFTCKQILNTLGTDVYLNIYHDDLNAMKCYQEALSFYNNDPSREMNDKIETLNIYTHIAEINVGKNQYDTAAFYFQKAFAQIRPGSSEEQILNSPDPTFLQKKKVYYITNLMIAKGDAFIRRYKWSGNKQFLNDALHVYRVTDQFLDLLRKEQTETDSKLFWRKDTRRLYEHAIDACLEAKDESSAFYFFEKSRAALLNDQLTHQRWVDDKEIRKEIQLTKYIVQLQRAIDTTDPAAKKYGELISDKIVQTRNLENIRQQIKSNNPLYYHNLVDTGVLTLSMARNFILPQYQALLETFAGDSAVYILIVSGEGNSLKKLDKQLYEKLANEFSGLLSDPGDLNRNFNAFRKTANELYTLIFQGTSIPPGRIIISPDGKNIPYEALVISASNEIPKYLVQDYAVSYTFSAQFLESMPSYMTKEKSDDFLGMAPINFNASFRLLPLPGSDQSLQRINHLFRNAVMITGNAVTPAKFMDEFHQFQVVQLYTHAADSGKFREPVIYFGDSSLSLSDLVYEERPLTRLIVLSACETASGKFYQGEGVFSFSRGFAALGIPSSISNLWSVENESTYRLTELFYKYLAEGLPLDIALQKAKLDFLSTASREKQLPYFWSALVLAGSADPIVLKKPMPVPFILTGITAMLFVLAFAARWWTRKKSIPTQGKAESVS